MTANVNVIAVDDRFLRQLRLVKDWDFRALVDSTVYLMDVFFCLSRSPEDLGLDVGDCKDAIAYCYVDEELGICFRCLCAARLEGNEIDLLDAFGDVSLTLRRATVQNSLCAPLESEQLDAYADVIAAIDEEHACDSFTYEMRHLLELDDLRNSDFPDLIKTVLMNPIDPDTYELVWTKPWATSDDVPQCVLMSEPANEAFGAHEGDVFPLAFQKQPDGLIAIALAGGE